MEFDVLALLYTMGCCLTSMIIAGKSASKENKEWFENLKHPKNAFILKYMSIIGFGFYLLFGYVLYQLIVCIDIVSIVLSVVIIQLMGLSPFLLYKTKKLKLFFLAMLVFPVLVPIFIFFLIQASLTLATIVIAYFVYLVYDMSYFYRLMKLNQ